MSGREVVEKGSNPCLFVSFGGQTKDPARTLRDMSMRQIRELILRHAPPQGMSGAPIEGLQLFRVTEPLPTTPTIYPACLCLLVEGEKRIYLGGETKSYDPSSFVCCTMPLPVEAEVPHASASSPALGLLLSLETPMMSETLVVTEATGHLDVERGTTESASGLTVAAWDEPFLDAVLRLLQLLDDPSARQVLAPSRLRELYFALLRTEAGGVVRRTFGASRDLGRALTFLHEHIGEAMSVDELASVAGMSKPVFHRRFKEATTLSPLQFIKAVRLNNAAALIVGGMNVAEAAGEVGYGSPSQFSREFGRQFGMSPRQWASNAVPGAARS